MTKTQRLMKSEPGKPLVFNDDTLTLVLTRAMYNDFGHPTEITLTIAAGDTLNA